MKVLVDLNILLDVFQKREPHFHDSRESLTSLQNGEHLLLLSSHCIPTLYYILRKTAGKEKARECISWVLDVFEISFCSKAILRKACDGPYEDLEDGIIIEEARSEVCDLVLTRDTSGFKNCPIPVTDPSTFLSQL